MFFLCVKLDTNISNWLIWVLNSIYYIHTELLLDRLSYILSQIFDYPITSAPTILWECVYNLERYQYLLSVWSNETFWLWFKSLMMLNIYQHCGFWIILSFLLMCQTLYLHKINLLTNHLFIWTTWIMAYIPSIYPMYLSPLSGDV